MRVYMLSDMESEKKLRVYTASEAKGLKERKPQDVHVHVTTMAELAEKFVEARSGVFGQDGIKTTCSIPIPPTHK